LVMSYCRVMRTVFLISYISTIICCIESVISILRTTICTSL
jgi:hypothetical protein